MELFYSSACSLLALTSPPPSASTATARARSCTRGLLVEDFTVGTFKGDYLGNEEARYADDKEKVCHDIVFARFSETKLKTSKSSPMVGKMTETGMQFILGSGGAASVNIQLRDVACCALCPKRYSDSCSTLPLPLPMAMSLSIHVPLVGGPRPTLAPPRLRNLTSPKSGDKEKEGKKNKTKQTRSLCLCLFMND